LDSYEQIGNGEIKQCLKCGKYKVLKEFYDESLKTGTDKVCMSCKKRTTKDSFQTKAVLNTSTEKGKLCPVCNSAMVLRNGKYGKFYGCSRYPYCKGTRKHL
jgi:ssDNA-binding Zn-finger/Zn-ribbon topoisomerase 1